MKRLAILFIVLALGLTAWPSAAGEPVKLGAFFALSGPASHIGTPTKLVAQMVVDQINKEGGINGRPIALVLGDTESDAAKAAVIAKKFVFSDKVAAIIGPTSTAEGMSAKRIVEEAGVPTFMTVGGDPVIMGGKFGAYTYVFKSPQRSSTAVRKLYGYLKAKGLTRVALFTNSDGFGKDGLGWLEQGAPEFGISFSAKESFGPADTDMTAQLTKIKNSGAQAIVVWTVGPAGAIVTKNKAQLGIQIPLFQCHGQPDPTYVDLAGKASEGDRMPATKLMVGAALPDSDPQKKVIAEFMRLYTDVHKYDKQFPVNTHSGYAWDAIMIVASAMKRAGTEPKALRAAIEQTKGYVGVSGVYNLTAEDHNGLGTDSMVMVQVKGGKFVLAE
jgi:branched-chain amino acid transport system substrate-binding protein